MEEEGIEQLVQGDTGCRARCPGTQKHPRALPCPPTVCLYVTAVLGHGYPVSNLS